MVNIFHALFFNYNLVIFLLLISFFGDCKTITKKIEDMDKNLLRFNVKKEANEFLEKVIVTNDGLDGERILLHSLKKKNTKKKK